MTSTTSVPRDILAELADVGRSRTTGGYNRFAWSDAELAAREWFVARAEDIGLDVETDRNGNLWAWWRADLPGTAFVCGSHLDSVPEGGLWDGPLGVAAAFAAVAELVASGMRPRRPIAIVAFSDEEGSRFGTACLGSRLMTGTLAPQHALGLTDATGTSLAEVLRAHGHAPEHVGADRDRLARIGEFVEVHVEQGHLPVAHVERAEGLISLGEPLGLATQIWPHGRWRFDLPGVANHAGTTPLADRSDPVLHMARGIVAVREAAEELGVLATVGRVDVEPGAVNAIASLARLWVDARGADAERVRALTGQVAERMGRPAIEESWTPVVSFDTELAESIDAAVGRTLPRLPSGAGHDAGVMALAGIPTAMILVRNVTGVSHSPAEHVDLPDAAAGVAALRAVLLARAV
ncbi:allantoate amidohydrolase [Microbacterium sp. SLBN-146]|uniref:allantoate amidohydrolase n=1 Tax=Microbacterium sp. SLBN-146 TaxID=2768457 RepID=UPI001152A12C|nr:allantoate amidohydrolase [Microbacterium sp. SLBN-146]TQJ29751.1 N-carbamoyl-L-amino-acid hydrolase [Microbacterium sp. SLBN-146]